MKGDYAQYTAARNLTGFMGIGAGLAALWMQCLQLPFEPWADHPLNPLRQLDQNPVEIEVKGIRQAAARTPLKDVANEMPDRLKILIGAGNDNDRSDKNTTVLATSMARPYRNLWALSTMFNLAAQNGDEPEFGITEATIDGKRYPVTVEKVMGSPCGDLLHFSTGRKGAPVLYIAAPMSGHGTTLIKDPLRSALNAGFDVYTNGIPNFRDVPVSEGNPGLEDYIGFNREILQRLGPNANVWAICQATVPVAAAVATLAMEGNPNRPASLTLMAGPINPRAAKTEVSEFARRNPFSQDLISEVPPGYKGEGRKVYAANIRQIPGFMAMHLGEHAAAFANMHNHIVRGTENSDDFKKSMAFYKDYLNGKDLPDRFYEDTYTKIFVNNDFAEGRLTWHGKPIDPSAIDCALLTFEGSEDDISAPGQTMSAHKLMPKAHENGMGFHFTLQGSGHFGTFTGSNTRTNGIPAIVAFIARATKERGLDFGPLLGADGNRLEHIPALQHFDQSVLDSTLAAQEVKWATHCRGKEIVPSGPAGVSISLPLPAAA